MKKRLIAMCLSFVLICCFSVPAFAVGDGNIDGGGGGMGDGTSTNSWSPGNDGVRVTVVKAENHSPVTTPIDLTNKKPPSTLFIFPLKFCGVVPIRRASSATLISDVRTHNHLDLFRNRHFGYLVI